MADIKRFYWDSCVWIALIAEEQGRVDRCESIIKQARNVDLEVWTSSLTLAEVYKFKCGSEFKRLAEEKDAAFESYLQQPFVVEVQVDHAIGVLARRLLRSHSELKKPNDAIHLATAAISNVEALHTFDSENLIPLTGKIQRADGLPLKICEPPAPPIIGSQNDMFETGASNDRSDKTSQ